MLNLLATPSVIAIGSLNVALIDLIVLGILIIAFFIGLARGFIGQILSLLGGIAALILSFVLCKHLAGFIGDKIPSLTESISGMVNKLFGLEGVVTAGTKEEIIATLQTTKIPSFLHSIVANSIVSSEGTLKLTEVLTEWALVAISFVVIFILALILFAIIKKVFKALTKIKGVGAVNRILGALLMLVKAIIFCVILSLILSVFIDMNAILSPKLSNGEEVKSIFNSVITKIMELPFIQNAFN